MVTPDQETAATGSTRARVGRSAITGRLFRAAFLLYLAAAVSITCALVAESYLTTRDDLKRELSIYQRTLEGTLSGPLWALDIPEIERIATGMAQLSDIDGVLVLDHNQAREFARAGFIPGTAAGDNVAGDNAAGETDSSERTGDHWLGGPISVSFPVHHTHAVGRDRVGYVTLYSSPRVVLERVRWRVVLLVLAAIVKTVILWFIFERVGGSILVRPITRLTEAARRTGFARLEPVVFDPKTAAAARGTEIEILQTALNDMIADLRQSRDSLAALNVDLERRVADRTRELEVRSSEAAAATARVERARREVAAALEEAERAARAKSEFLALVSHELRTPLNSILGFSELIQRQMDEAPQSKESLALASYATAIHDSGSQLLTLINDILDLSRIEAGRMEVSPEWIDTGATTRTVVEVMREAATKRRMTLESRLDPATPMLKVDPRRYRQMLMNLLSNAIKYTQTGGEIRLDARHRADGWLEIIVSDSGVGMDAGDIERALEPFNRGTDVTTRRSSGAGLGLPLVARMMQLHGGRLSLESTVGSGTRAILRFPPGVVQVFSQD